ncbi:MAG TPA: hypothetical protein VFV03_02975, partial [Solirubrobacteraceae bacterium]|nr:hypothetical protein [Solirubrobacteraceae bacterium]
MTLWHRAPREVYRVYGEDEYLADDAPSAGDGSHPTQAHEHEIDHHAAAASWSHRSRSGRLVGLGLLVGVTVSALGLVAVNTAHRPPAASRAGVTQIARAGAGHH